MTLAGQHARRGIGSDGEHQREAQRPLGGGRAGDQVEDGTMGRGQLFACKEQFPNFPGRIASRREIVNVAAHPVWEPVDRGDQLLAAMALAASWAPRRARISACHHDHPDLGLDHDHGHAPAPDTDHDLDPPDPDLDLDQRRHDLDPPDSDPDLDQRRQ